MNSLTIVKSGFGHQMGSGRLGCGEFGRAPEVACAVMSVVGENRQLHHLLLVRPQVKSSDRGKRQTEMLLELFG
jgi:hypothetical protein